MMDTPDFIERVLRNPINREILRLMLETGLPDAWLTSGALFQTVWNTLTKRDPSYGIKDYDIFYFDDADLSVNDLVAALMKAGYAVPEYSQTE